MASDKIGIVGYGVVGRSLHRLFGDAAVIVDKEAKPADRELVNACPVVFVCVPTPSRPDGSCDTGIVEECLGWLDGPQIVLRSTVPPGTTERLRQATGRPIIFQPEYLGETVAHPMADVRSHTFIILGGPTAECSLVADLYARHYHSQIQFHFTTSRTAELAKYMCNAYFAVKVLFCNEFFDLARAHGVDYHELREIWLADPRINRDHTFVYPDNRGFSGKCLPKDTAAIVAASQELGCPAPLLEAVMRINGGYREGDPIVAPYTKLFGGDRGAGPGPAKSKQGTSKTKTSRRRGSRKGGR